MKTDYVYWKYYIIEIIIKIYQIIVPFHVKELWKKENGETWLLSMILCYKKMT